MTHTVASATGGFAAGGAYASQTTTTMLQLFLNNTQVFPSPEQTIKLTRENAYFTRSGSYTLDVVIPMDIIQNRIFFRNLQRIEHRKAKAHYPCRLVVGHKDALNGKATVTQVTDEQVRLQLLGDRSEVNFLSEENADYIDELTLGQFNVMAGNPFDTNEEGNIHQFFSRVFNETTGHIVKTYHPRLLDVATAILAHYGYRLTDIDLPNGPWQDIYIANAKKTLFIAHTLPHWKTREFFDELSDFLNATIVFGKADKRVRIVSNIYFTRPANTTTIQPIDEYQAEIAEEDAIATIATDNISYDLSESEAHDYDSIPDSLLLFRRTRSYASLAMLRQAYNNATEEQRKHFLFKCPKGKYAEWEHKYPHFGMSNVTALTSIDFLAPLTRANDAKERKLRICPVAIDITTGRAYESQQLCDIAAIVPSLENPTGQELREFIPYYPEDDEGVEEYDENEQYTLQEIIEQDIQPEETQKEDRMQVMFADSAGQIYVRNSSTAKHLTGFTDHRFKVAPGSEQHHRWSLSLCDTDAEYYLGQLHNNPYTINTAVKHTFKFLAEDMPDPSLIYIIKGKRYACEKIEANVTEHGFDRLMTGYFYEIL